MTKAIRKKKIHRRFTRRSASSKVRVTCHKRGANSSAFNLISAVLDLSEAGARLLLRAPLEAGEEVVLCVEVPSYDAPLTRPGKVIWSFPVTEDSYVAGVCLKEEFDTKDVRQATVHPVRLDY